MSSLASVFLHSNTTAVLKQLVDVISGDKISYTRTSNIPQDVSADLGLRGARELLKRAAGSRDDALMNTYISESEHYLHLVMSIGISEILMPPVGHESSERLLRLAPTLSIPSILAETYLGATSWAQHDKAATIRYLSSSLEKATTSANCYPAKLVDVNEEESVLVNGLASWRKRWSYRGRRPTKGSSARLAQDIEVALRVAQTGQIPQLLDVYGSWDQIVDAS